MAQKRKKPIIGFLVSGIMDDYTRQLCEGVLHAAKSLDVTIVVMPGKYLDRDLPEGDIGMMYEYQHNTIFSYARPDNVDAILVAADCIGCLTTRDRLLNLMETYSGIPTILVASRLEGYPNVSYDNANGIREGMEYLINHLGCRNFGMIGGPDDNYDAHERKQVFLNVLAEHHIEFKPDAYVEGNLSECSQESLNYLFDRNPDLEAIVCVNDATALNLYRELQRRGIRPGRDISVLGFDDSLGATRANPPLSSVSADPAALGHQALLAIMKVLDGQEAGSIEIPTKFVRRASFCSTPVNGGRATAQASPIIDPDSIFDEIFYRYDRDTFTEELQPLRNACNALINSITHYFEGNGPLTDARSSIMSYVDTFLNAGAVQYADMGILLVVFDRIKQILTDLQPDPERVGELKEVFAAIYKNIIRSMDDQAQYLSARSHEENNFIKMFIYGLFSFEKGSDQSYTNLLSSLNWLNIDNAFLYTFEKPILHLNKEQFTPPHQLYLKAVRLRGEVSMVPLQKQTVPIEELYCNSLMDSEENYRLVLLPLFSAEMLHGLLLCDLADSIYEDGEFLTSQMGTATKMIHLLLSNKEIQQQLEDNLVTLRENNIVLDALSKSDGLTGILNRRGFEDSAEQLLALNRKSGKNTLVIYVDMNNLKIINDRYGHEEGDFSLRHIADTLSNITDSNGIVGRIGGDEYACLLTYQGTENGEEILNVIYDAFDSFNKTSSKSYNITVAAGCCMLEPESELSLAAAMAEADVQLYKVKHLRKKEVEKTT